MMDHMGWSCCWVCLTQATTWLSLDRVARAISVQPVDFAPAWYLKQWRNLELSLRRHILLERVHNALPKTKHQCFPGDECGYG